MSSPNKHPINDIQHQPLPTSTQSLTTLLLDRHDTNQHDNKENSYNSDPSLDQRQRNRDLERQSIAPFSRSSSSSTFHRHGRNDSDGKHKSSAQIQTQTLQHSFEDMDRLQAEKQQQLGLKGASDGHSIVASSFSSHSTSQCRPPLSPSSCSSHHITLSDGSHPSDHQLISDIDSYYASLTPPYSECPLVTDNLHLPVPTTMHRYFIYEDDVYDPIDKEHNDDKAFETMASRLCPYPFRSRAPLGGRLKRKPPPVEQQDHDMDAAKRYPSLLTQQREKRHSLGNGQIDRLVHGKKSLLKEYELSDLLFDPHQNVPNPSPAPSASVLGYPPPPPPPPQQQHENQNDPLLEDRIHWLTQGYYLVPPSPQNSTPSPPGSHDLPPSLYSSPTSSSSLV